MSIADVDRSKLLPLAGIAAPITAVCIARVLLSVGPSEAPAAGVDSYAHHLPIVAASLPTVSPSTEQLAALDYLSSVPARQTLRSPMVVPLPPDLIPIDPIQPVVELDDPSALLVLNSIVGKGDRALASIGNHIYRVGAEPMPGWVIESIDATGRMVQLRHTSGAEAVLTYRVDTGSEE